MNNRKNFLINPKFQISYIKHTLSLLIFVILIFYSANLYFFWNLKNQGLSVGLSTEHVFFQFINEQQNTMDLIFVITSVIATLSMFAFGIFISHRVAGPLYRMHRYFVENRGKNFEKKLSFRQGDYFVELADAFNNYANDLKKNS